jgi:hypothetical protein
VTSTVLDAALCLLLVSAGAVTLVTVPDAGGVASPAGTGAEHLDDDRDRADALATTLTTATASVNYTLAPGAREAGGTPVAFPHTEGSQFERTSRGTLAGLLADATLASVQVGGTRLDHTGDDFRRGVRARTLEAVGANAQVAAVWRPVPDGPVEGRLVVGPDPPADRSVHASVVRVPTGFGSVERRAGQRTQRGAAPDTADDTPRERLAHRIAAVVVTGLLPPEETAFALDGDYPVTALTRHRYHRLATLLGVDLDGSVPSEPANANVTRATRLLTDGLAERLSAGLRHSEETALQTESESGVGVGRVRITVRTWGAS